MSETIRISVITPSFNQAGFIERTIRSILDQQVTFPVEYIIIDGASTDGTIKLLKQYKGPVKWISEKDKGQSDAVNKGIAMASGEIIGWINSDDVYLPGALQKVVKLFDLHPDRQWLYGRCMIIDENDLEVRKWITRYKNFRSRQLRYNRLLTENFISQPAVFFRKEAFLKSGQLNLSLHYAMDFDLWLRFGRISQPIISKDYLAAFRVHCSSKSISNVHKLFLEQYEVHKKFDKRKYLLLLHRFKIQIILFSYWVIEKAMKKPL